MKRLLLTISLFILFGTCFCYAQSNNSRLVLKSGIVVTGVIKEIVPSSHLVISVSGLDTRIDISDVAEILSENVSNDQVQTSEEEDYYKYIPEKLLQKELIDRPEEINLEVAGEKIPMVLIRGGIFSMGYDGRGSVKMNSEPIHKVFVSSFYISKTTLSLRTICALKGEKKIPSSYEGKAYISSERREADKVINLVNTNSSIPVRLPTEAEWEYIAQNKNLKDKAQFIEGETNFCHDRAGDYSASNILQINPMGPKNSYKSIIRTFGPDKSVYCNRIELYDKNPYGPGYCASIRVVIPVSDTLNHSIK